MKLFEIRDISDFRSGDQHDPRSPYYEDPFPNGIPDMFMPNMPEFDVKVESGKAPNGEDYNFIMVSSYDKNDRDQYMIWEHALNEIAGNKKFDQSELVDQVDQTKGNKVTWVDYYSAGRGFPVNDVVATLNEYAKEIAEKIGEKNAHEYDGSDDY
jgi:hypothetical protein